jgi:hypothetical protein
MVGLRDFKLRLATFKEPVKVVRTRGELVVLGTWTPTVKSDAQEFGENKKWLVHGVHRPGEDRDRATQEPVDT